MCQVMIFGVTRERWFDASFSLSTAEQMNAGRQVIWGQHDVHPPGHFILLAQWLEIPHKWPGDYIWAQELSVLYGVAFIVLVVLLLYRLFGDAGAYAGIMMSMLTTYIHYAHEIRQYILLMLLCALFVYALVKRFEGAWGVVAVGAMAALPWMQYISAAVAIPWLLVMTFIYGSAIKLEKKWRWLVVLGIVALVSVAFVAPIALEQKARVHGAWFKPSTLDSWPAAMSYALFMVDNNFQVFHWYDRVFLFGVYLAVVTGAVILFRKVWKSLGTEDGKRPENVMFTMMVMTAVVPLIGLAGTTFLGQGFNNLYHHRFYLVVTWMFAAALMTYVSQRWGWKVFLLVPVVAAMWMLYVTGMVHHELGNLMQNMTCDSEERVIVHQSPASGVPFDVYGWEKGCNWTNVVTTNWTKKMLNGGGGDAMEGRIFWNFTVPNVSTYYAATSSFGWIPITGPYQVLDNEDGISMWKVYARDGPKDQMCCDNTAVCTTKRIDDCPCVPRACNSAP
jgi:uncharacterized membrane protein